MEPSVSGILSGSLNSSVDANLAHRCPGLGHHEHGNALDGAARPDQHEHTRGRLIFIGAFLQALRVLCDKPGHLRRDRPVIDGDRGPDFCLRKVRELRTAAGMSSLFSNLFLFRILAGPGYHNRGLRHVERAYRQTIVTGYWFQKPKHR